MRANTVLMVGSMTQWYDLTDLQDMWQANSLASYCCQCGLEAVAYTMIQRSWVWAPVRSNSGVHSLSKSRLKWTTGLLCWCQRLHALSLLKKNLTNAEHMCDAIKWQCTDANCFFSNKTCSYTNQHMSQHNAKQNINTEESPNEGTNDSRKYNIWLLALQVSQSTTSCKYVDI